MIKKTFSILFVMLLFVLHISCENEPLDDDFPSSINTPTNPDPNNPNLPDTTNPPTAPGQGSTGDYWPTAVGNIWIYETTLDDGTVNDLEYEILSETSYDGVPAFELSSFFVDQDFDFDIPEGFPMDDFEVPEVSSSGYLIKNEGNYGFYNTTVDLDFMGISTSIDAFGYVFFKDYLNAGESFTGTFNYEISFGFDLGEEFEDFPDFDFGDLSTQLVTDYVTEIIERDIEMTVNDVTYSNIIHVRYTSTTSLVGENESFETISDIYMAKDIGPIKMVYSEDGEFTGNSELVSYELN